MGLNDRMMHKFARELKDKQLQATALNQDITKIKTKLLNELERRGVKKLEFADGVKITFVQAEGVQYDDAAILDSLTPAQRKRVISIVLDRGLLSQQIQAGRIDQAVLENNSHVVRNNPYVVVNVIKTDDAE